MEGTPQGELMSANRIINKIIIIGAGGHAAEIHDYIRYIINMGSEHPQSISYELAGVIDDNPDTYEKYKFKCEYLGSINGHKVQNDCRYVIGIANLEFRHKIVERFLKEGAQFETLVHPSAYVSETARIGTGSVIAPNVNLGPNVSVGSFTLVNARCSLGHDTKVGDFNFISPNVCFSGGTSVGDHNLFGINSATIPGIKVGNRNKIMAGMVLDKNVGDDETVFYRHKEKVIAIPRK